MKNSLEVPVIFDDLTKNLCFYREINSFKLNNIKMSLFDHLENWENNFYLFDETLSNKFIIYDPEREFNHFKIKVIDCIRKMNIINKEINYVISKCLNYQKLSEALLEMYIIGFLCKYDEAILLKGGLDRMGFINFYDNLLMFLNNKEIDLSSNEIKYVLYLLFFNFTSRKAYHNSDKLNCNYFISLKDNINIKFEVGQIISPFDFLFITNSIEEDNSNLLITIDEKQCDDEGYYNNIIDLGKMNLNFFEKEENLLKGKFLLLPLTKLRINESSIENSKLILKLSVENCNSYYKLLNVNYFNYYSNFPKMNNVRIDFNLLFNRNLSFFNNYLKILDKLDNRINQPLIKVKINEAIGLIYKNQRNYPEVLNSYEKAISIIENSQNKRQNLDMLSDLYYEMIKSKINLYDIRSSLGDLKKFYDFLKEDLYDNKSIISLKLSTTECWILYNQNKTNDCLNLLKILSTLFDDSNNSLKQEYPLIYADFLKESGVLHMSMGYFSEAEENFNKALKIYEDFYLTPSFDLSLIYFDLGCLFRYKGNTDKALTLFIKSCEIIETVYGKNYFDIYHVFEQIGNCYLNYNQTEKYRDYFNRCYTLIDSSIKILELSLSNENSQSFNKHQMLILIEKLGFCQFNLGDYTSAIVNFQKTEQMFKSLGKEDSNIIHFTSQLINIGNTHYAMNSFDKALEIYTRALKARRTIFEENSCDIAKVYTKLGNTYFSLKQYELAVKIYEKSLKIYLSIFSEDHIFTANQYTNIANCYYENKVFQKSLELHEKSYALRVLLLGDGYDTILSLIRLGDCYYMLQENKKAFEMYSEALNKCRKVFGENHYVTLNHLNNLALVYYNSGQYDRAIDFYKEIIFIKIKLFGHINDKVADSYNQLGNCYCYLGNLPESLEYYDKSKKSYLILYGENSVQLANLINNIANIYIYKGMYTEAEKEHFKALAMRLLILGENNIDIAHSYSSLGLLFFHLNNLPKSIEFHSKACDIFLKLEGKHSVSLAREYKRLASIHFYLNNYPTTINFYNLCLKSLYIHYGDRESIESSEVYLSMAGVYKLMTQYRKALEYYLKTLDVRFELYQTEEHSGYYTLLLNIAEMYDLLKDDMKVLYYYEKYISIVDKLDKPEIYNVIQGKIFLLKDKLNKN